MSCLIQANFGQNFVGSKDGLVTLGDYLGPVGLENSPFVA